MAYRPPAVAFASLRARWERAERERAAKINGRHLMDALGGLKERDRVERGTGTRPLISHAHVLAARTARRAETLGVHAAPCNPSILPTPPVH